MAADGFDAASLRARLAEATNLRYAEIDVVESIDSTNSELLRRRTPAAGIAALFAHRQQAGRGRQGRRWSSPPGGGLYCSLARCFDGSLARLGGLSLAVGTALADAVRTLGAEGVRVKWPNDLVVSSGVSSGVSGGVSGGVASGIDDDGSLRKLGGVLIEGGIQDGRSRAVIGFGLNLRLPASEATAIDQPWADLHTLLGAAMPTRTAIAAALLTALADALDHFDAHGLAPFLPRFQALDALRGCEVIAQRDGRTVSGIGIGLADDGALRLATAEGEMLLRAGDISVRRRAAPSRNRA